MQMIESEVLPSLLTGSGGVVWRFLVKDEVYSIGQG